MRGFAAEVLSFDLFHSLFHYSLKKKKSMCLTFCMKGQHKVRHNRKVEVAQAPS